MTIEEAPETAAKNYRSINVDRHSSEWRINFVAASDDYHATSPVAWHEAHDGYWFVNGNQQVFDIARRADLLSNDADVYNQRKGYKGINIPSPEGRTTIGGFLEMDPPEQRHYRKALNAYLSPAAVARWQPVLDEITRACLDEVIETGRIDFVDDLANIVPAVVTMAMLGCPLKDWVVYCEPAHAGVYTRPDSPDMPRVMALQEEMGARMFASIAEIRQTPRPGLINALINADINGKSTQDIDVLQATMLLVGGGFDTTTALTAHALEWLSENPNERDWLRREQDTLIDTATEEFLRFYTPAQGDGRTVSQDAEIHGIQFREGDRLWLSWAMSNRDAGVFEDPHTIHLDRKGNRHASFGLGIHRCIGSNVARATFKTMVKAVLDRLPDFVCDPSGAVHYDTTAVINGMKHLPAAFTPGQRLGPGFAETLEILQKQVVEQGLAEPVTRGSADA